MAAAPFQFFPGAPQPRIAVKKTLSKWAQVGLNLSDPGLSKLHSKELYFLDNNKKYDLELEKFEAFKQNLIEKVNRMHSNNVIMIDDDASNLRHVLKDYTLMNSENVSDAAELYWPTVDPPFLNQQEIDIFTNRQLKSSVIGNYINESLTDNVKNQLCADQNLFEVEDTDNNPYFDGPSYFWKIAELVDSDNGHLIKNI
jgi:hypothetical protein